MSYIRCTSNHEGLYVWSSSDGNTYFSADFDYISTSYETSNQPLLVPTTVLDAFINKINGGGLDGWIGIEPIIYQNTEYRIAIESGLYSCRYRKFLTEPAYTALFDGLDMMSPESRSYKIMLRLSINESSIYIYYTTWIYFYRNYLSMRRMR